MREERQAWTIEPVYDFLHGGWWIVKQTIIRRVKNRKRREKA